MKNNLFETIKILNGKIYSLAYHQQRCDNSLKALHVKKRYNLKNLIHPPRHGLFRCKITYNEKAIQVHYHQYHFNPIDSLQLVTSNIDYSLKFQDRKELDTLFNQRKKSEDVIIVKNSYLTDTTKANIVLFDGSTWYTPKIPLLFGTTRERLLDTKKIYTLDIKTQDIDKFSQIAIINAMIGFYIVKNGIIL